MAWSSSNRSARLPRNWKTITHRIHKRDGFRCTAVIEDGSRCPNPSDAVDHIRNNDDHSDRNLRAICNSCHSMKTAMESATARAANRRRQQAKFSRTEQHPGLTGP